MISDTTVYVCAGLGAADPETTHPVVSTLYVCAGFRSDEVTPTPPVEDDIPTSRILLKLGRL